MKKRCAIVLMLVFIACGKQSKNINLDDLNGYWEISKVELSKDSVIQYSISQYVDYFEVTDSTGIRTKLQPNIDGSFVATKDQSEIEILKSDGDIQLLYSTPFDEWKEQLVSLDEENMIVINQDGKKYYYKRYEPLISGENGETKE